MLMSPILDAGLTVKARFKVSQTQSNAFVTQNQGGTGKGDFFNIYTSKNLLRFGLRAKDNSTWHQPNLAFTDTKGWHHFIAVYNGKKSFFYVDGELVAESKEFKICQDAENPVRIGSRAGDFGRPVEGWIDEVRIYNRGLTPKEVQQNFDSEGLAVGAKQKLAVTWGNSKRLDSVPSTNSAVTKGCRQKKVATSYRWSFSIVVVIELVDKSIFISSGRC